VSTEEVVNAAPVFAGKEGEGSASAVPISSDNVAAVSTVAASTVESGSATPLSAGKEVASSSDSSSSGSSSSTGSSSGGEYEEEEEEEDTTPVVGGSGSSGTAAAVTAATSIPHWTLGDDVLPKELGFIPASVLQRSEEEE
jgi:hypothetical protein